MNKYQENLKNKQLSNKLDECWRYISANIHFKPNPNHYPIIDKWNMMYQWNPHKRVVFNYLEELLEISYSDRLTSDNFLKFVNIKDLYKPQPDIYKQIQDDLKKQHDRWCNLNYKVDFKF